FLEKFAPTREMALLSSTPHDILLHILEKRKIGHYFKIIQGAPVHKASWLKQFRTEKNCKPSEMLFIGDSEEDAQSAKDAGIAFLQIGPILPDFNALSPL
ncbi:MAG: HAD family hydrolase, partial [bacterium]|nr:HAD family hydrolase [bacterium]